MAELLVFFVLLVLTGVAAARHAGPATTDRRWSVGAMLDRPPR